MAVMVILQLAVTQIPHLDELIPAGRHDDWVRCRRRKAHTRHPVLRAQSDLLKKGTLKNANRMHFRLRCVTIDRVLALCQGVPQLDRLVTRRRHDLHKKFSSSGS